MKKNILYTLISLLVISCGVKVKKPEQRSKFLKGFNTYYNTLFNAKDALNTEFEGRNKAYRDNFYAPYIPVLTYEEQPLGSDLGQSTSFAENSAKMAEVRQAGQGRNPNINTSSNFQGMPPQPGTMGNNVPTDPNNPLETKGATVLEISEAKALKAIGKYSVIRKNEEQNKTIFDAYMILVQSRIYQGKTLQALDALNYIYTHMKEDKRLPLAKVYEGLAYAKLKDYYRADEIFSDLKSQGLNKNYDKLLSIYYAESLLDSGKKDLAVAELDRAFDLNGNRKLKSRIAFLRGQILQEQGKNEAARESFLAAYKYANDFEFEVKSQIEIAKTYNGKGEYAGARKYLEDISKKGTYASRKNEFYYALGLMASKAGNRAEAQDFFRKSLAEKVSDQQVRGLAYYEIGRDYLDKNDYIGAGAYYDSALVAMTYEPSKILLQDQAINIKKISKNYYLIKKNDSILSLAMMPAAQRNDYFARYIDTIKEKEAREEVEKKRAERNKGFETGDYNANSLFANSSTSFEDFGVTSKGFYFGNNSTVSRGTAAFKQIWGDRALIDNWRYSKKMASIEDLKNEALGTTSAPNPRRFEPSFYIEQLPSDAGTLAQLKKDRDTASLGLGVMYQNYFTNTPLATKTLYNLVDNKPEEKVMLQALYEIFAMNYEKNPQAAARAKQILLQDYPYTSYAEFARNPKNSTFVKSSSDVENNYKTAFALYESERFTESQQIIEQTIEKNPKDALVPKLSLLNAFNAGKSNGKEVMILQLQQIVLNYAKTPEGIRAKEMLDYLKSDIAVQMTDSQGNPVQNVQQQNMAPTRRSNAGMMPNMPNATDPTSQNIPMQNATQPLNNAIQTNQIKKPVENTPQYNITNPNALPPKIK